MDAKRRHEREFGKWTGGVEPRQELDVAQKIEGERRSRRCLKAVCC